MGSFVASQAFFSVLRWRADPTRDEAKNVAVLLVDEDGTLGGFRAAPISSVSPRLRDQGLLDATLVALGHRFDGEAKPRLADLRTMRQQLKRSLYLTEPQPVALGDLDVTLNALYRAFAAPRVGASSAPTKGRVLDRALVLMRRQGWVVRRGEYVGDFIFDFVVDSPRRVFGDVLSFATGARNLVPVEQDAGHFLYGLRRLDASGMAVIKGPAPDADDKTWASYRRVSGWFQHEQVHLLNPEDLELPRQEPLPV